MAPSRSAARQKRHHRIRLTVEGTQVRPRLAVFRSLNQIYAQVIDDSSGRTLASASSMERELRSASGTKSERASRVGALIGERAREAGVSKVV
ncbi:MAG: 50S ribosomal protein L18, partial [Chloroflexi bacterium]|nr:50S ribosomal protein L18 [Chloroflexota bacterium]